MNQKINEFQPSAVPGGYQPEKISAFHFGACERRLYGCLHTPAVPPRPVAVLLCAPLGYEYQQCHRALRELAKQLATRGFFVLRFDYYGSGDSAGEFSQVTMAGASADLEQAIAELKRRSGADKVAIVGLRTGATIALRAAFGRDDIRALVLWSPVLNGAKMLAEWDALQREHEQVLGYQPSGEGLQEVMGMELPPALRAEFRQLDLASTVLKVPRLLVLHHEADPHVAAMVANAGGLGADVESRQSTGVSFWGHNTLDAVVPFEVLRQIANWI